MGHSIGIISLGRRIVLIEGEHNSLDKQTYGSILKNRFPNLVLVPSGGKSNINSFSTINDKILNHTIWGVDFFMICDHDAAPVNKTKNNDDKQPSTDRFRLLPKYHLENYFLDENVIAEIFKTFEPRDSWLRKPQEILMKLEEIARGYVPYAAALIVSSYFRERVGNLDIMPKGVHSKNAAQLAEAMCKKAQLEGLRINSEIDSDEINIKIRNTISHLESGFDKDYSWKNDIPGRPILNTFCGNKYANMDVGRFKTAYLSMADEGPFDPFSDVIRIFEDFSKG